MKSWRKGIPLVSCLVILAFLGWVSSAEPTSPDPPSARGQSSALFQEETKLARSRDLYLIVDVAKRCVTLKAKGIVLRTFTVTGVGVFRVGGSLNAGAIATFTKKHPTIEPVKIIPPTAEERGGGGEGTAPVSLGVTAMPTHYDLVFDDGRVIFVRGVGNTSWFRQIFHALRVLSWYLKAFLLALHGTLLGIPRQFLFFEMTSAEAQALYWAMVPPLKAIVHVNGD